METERAISPNPHANAGEVADHLRVDADYVFHELTRSICPECRRVIDAKILLRDNKVYMSKRCPRCGPFVSLVYADAEAYVSYSHHNKPGTIPLAYGAAVERGCPHDCGLCPDHEQHACLGIIEVNSACDMDCPLCLPMRDRGSASRSKKSSSSCIGCWPMAQVSVMLPQWSEGGR